MVRQYIGARYVPKFFENPNNTAEWLPNVIYEPLTIVTYGLNSYTSKKTVPASVGDPSNNPEYWVVTSNLNALYQELRDDLDALDQREADDVEGLGEDISDLETAITNLDKNKVNNISNRRYLFVGDSYIATHSNTCVEKACSWLGITNYANISVSGTSFSAGTFLSQLSGYTGDKTKITDIYVIGGLNDALSETSSPTLISAINDFFTYAGTNYPNAHVTVCYAGHARDDSSVLNNKTWAKRNYALYDYSRTVMNNGGTIHKDMWQSLAISLDLMDSDGVHPNTYGQDSLARTLVQYLLGSDYLPFFPRYVFAGGTSDIKYSCNDGVINAYCNGELIVSKPNQTIAGNASIVINSNLTVYFNNEVRTPVTVMIRDFNNAGYKNCEAYIKLSGNTMSLELRNLNNDSASNGWEQIVLGDEGSFYISDFNVTTSMNNLL